MQRTVSAAPARRALSILAVNLRWPPHVAGGYELSAASAVRALSARGHRVTVLCGRGSRLVESERLLPWLEPELDRDGAERDLFALDLHGALAARYRSHFLSPRNLAATKRALARSRAERMLVFNLGLASRAPLLAARVLGVPCLAWVADRWPANHWLEQWRSDPAQRERKPERLAWLATYEAGFRAALGNPRFACASRWLARELARAGYAEADLSVHVPPLRSEFRGGVAPAEPRARARGEPLRVVCASMLWAGKGQHVLLAAAAQARGRGVALEVLLAGAGAADYEARLRELARDPRLAGAVRFAGRLDAAELARALAQAHVVALPSLWGEPLATAPLEGMLHGACALLSDDGGGPETIEHLREGWIARAGDVDAWAAALEALAGDEALRAALARAGRARALAWPDEHAFADGLLGEFDACGGPDAHAGVAP
ncbi:MAG: glycosyltransferase [Planctomycetota bacterium]|nr:MAG: glycosyltransferase [Planctomycetota bacterium]